MDKSRDARVKREINRLKKVFVDVPQEERVVCDGLIVQAARLRVMLDDAWKDINEKGDVEQFSQSPDLDPYERLRPVAQLYNTRDKNYQTIIKQLIDRIPEGSETESDASELLEFLNKGKRQDVRRRELC